MPNPALVHDTLRFAPVNSFVSYTDRLRPAALAHQAPHQSAAEPPADPRRCTAPARRACASRVGLL